MCFSLFLIDLIDNSLFKISNCVLIITWIREINDNNVMRKGEIENIFYKVITVPVKCYSDIWKMTLNSY